MPKAIRTQSHQATDMNTFMSLVCAYYAEQIARVTSRALFDHLWERARTKKISAHILPSPGRFLKKLDETIKGDLLALRRCWHALNCTQQRVEYERWVRPRDKRKQALAPDTLSVDLRGRVDRHIATLDDPNLREIAARVLRYSTLLKNLQAFRTALDGWEAAQGSVDMKELVYDAWTKLFAFMIFPVTRYGRSYRLRTLCVPPRFSTMHSPIPTMDKTAYSFFSDYAWDELGEISCADYRDAMNGGIRSLNCYYFNHLAALASCGDNPAALVMGCRSGVQYQIRSEGDPEKTIAMVAMYVPFHNFFTLMGIKGSGTFKADCRNAADNDAHYLEIWQGHDLEGLREQGALGLLQLLLTPLRGSAPRGCADLTQQMALVFGSWEALVAAIEGDPLPDDVRRAITEMEAEGFSADRATLLATWLAQKVVRPERPGLVSPKPAMAEREYETRLKSIASEWNNCVEKELAELPIPPVVVEGLKRMFCLQVWDALARVARAYEHVWEPPRFCAMPEPSPGTYQFGFTAFFWSGEITLDEKCTLTALTAKAARSSSDYQSVLPVLGPDEDQMKEAISTLQVMAGDYIEQSKDWKDIGG